MNLPPFVPALDHAALAEWILRAALLSLALGLTGCAAAVFLRKSHPKIRSLVLMTFVGAVPVVLFTGSPFKAGRGQGEDFETVNVSAGGLLFAKGSNSTRRPAVVTAAGETAGSPLPAAGYRVAREWQIPGAGKEVAFWAGLVWLAGSLAVAACWLLGQHRLREWRRKAVRTDPFDGLPVMFSSPCPQPVCAGLLRPVILLPTKLEHLPETQKLAVLRHEAAHIRHGDLWWLQLQWLALALNWWNPFMQRLSRQLSGALEECADLTVLRAGSPAVEYAQCLLDCARQLGGGKMMPTATVGMAKSVPLVKRRIVSLLSGRHADQPQPGGFGSIVSVLGALAVTLSVAAAVPAPGFEETPASGGPPPAQNSPSFPPRPDSAPAPATAPPAPSTLEPSQPTPSAPAAGSLNPAPDAPPSAGNSSPAPGNSPAPISEHGENPAPASSGGVAGKVFETFSQSWVKSLGDDKNDARFQCDKITVDPEGRRFTLEGKVKLVSSSVTLEADKVILETSQKDPASVKKFHKLTAFGKFRLQQGDQVVEGKNDQSTVELSEDPGTVKFTDAIVRTITPAPVKPPAEEKSPSR